MLEGVGICPKGMLNGPCGGYRGDYCEVVGECVWVNVYKKLCMEGGKCLEVFTKVNLSPYFKVRDYFPPPLRPTSKFIELLNRGKALAYEVFSQPVNLDLRILIKLLGRLANYVDAYVFVDSPMGLITYDQLTLALVARNYFSSVDVILNLSARGKSLDELSKYVVTALNSGVSNFIVVTGDWPRNAGNTLFTLDSTQLAYLIRLLSDLGINHSGRRVGIGGRAAHVGVAVNQYSDYIDLEVLRTVRKLRCGAEFIATQPIYSAGRFKEFIRRIKSSYPDIKVLATYAILDNIRRLEIISELGIKLSRSEKEHLINLLKSYDVIVANELTIKKILDEVGDLIDGIYISSYGNINLALKFLSNVSIKSIM